MQTETDNTLAGYSQREKSAYLSALASLATVDREASQEEIEQFKEMSEAAGLSAAEQREMIDAANDVSGHNLKRQLDELQDSELKYSLITDLIALAKVDGSYSQEERANIEKIAKYLRVDDQSYDQLDQAVSKAQSGNHSQEEMSSSGFMDKLGLGGLFGGGGSSRSRSGSIFGLLAPMVLGGMVSGMGRRGGSGLGRGLGQILGGAGGMGRRSSMGGGLGSLVSGITRSRNNNGLGGMLGRILR